MKYPTNQNNNKHQNKYANVPLYKKTNLTLYEASEYSGIGINKIREITNEEDCDFVLWVGTKRLIKLERFDRFIEKQYSI